MRLARLLLLTAGCAGPASSDPSPLAGSDSTPPEPQPQPGAVATVIGASCAPQPNVLRFDCTVETDLPGAARVRVEGPEGVVATFASDEPSTTHLVQVWGLTSETAYTFTAFAVDSPDVGLSGAMTTGELPELVDVVANVTGTPSSAAPAHLMFDWRCGELGSPEALVIVDQQGRVVWYLVPSDAEPVEDNFRGFSITPEGTVLSLLERKRILEWDFGGNVLFDRKLDDGELANAVHHDVARVGELTYVLTSKGVDYPDGVRYAMDGFDVYDAAGGLAASFTTEGLLDPMLVGPAGDYWSLVLGEGAQDWAHENALAVDTADLSVVLSLRYLNLLLKVVGDPSDPGFGTVLWSAQGGETEEPFPGTMTVVSSAGVAPADWGDQHHLSILDDGHLMMWDNRTFGLETSRALELAVDEAGAAIDVVREWESDQWCPGSGSAFHLANDNVLVVCNEEPTRSMEIAPDQTIGWTVTPSCANDYPTTHLMYRAVPVTRLYPSP